MKTLLLSVLLFTSLWGCTASSRFPLYDPYPGKHIQVVNVGEVVNTKEDNYAPSLSPDGRTLYFTGHQRVDSAHITGFRGTIYRVAIGADGDVEPSAKPEPILTTEYSAGGISFAGSGERIVFVSCSSFDRGNDCDLCEVSDPASSAPKISKLSQINTGYWETAPALSFDGKALYYTGLTNPEKEGSTGATSSRDIQFAYIKSDGFWSKSVPLNAPINSKDEEDGAYVTMGDSALFFSSNRPGGYGGYDLYVSFRQPDGSWGAIQNLGPTINSSSDERHITMTPDRKIIFFSSNRGGKGAKGRFDIYMARFADSP